MAGDLVAVSHGAAREAAVDPSPSAPGRGRGWLPLVCVATLMLLGHVPLGIRLADGLWAHPHYQFAVLLPVLAAALAWERLREQGAYPPIAGGRGRHAAAGLVAALSLTLAASLAWSQWLNAVAAWFTLAAGLYAVGGFALLRALAGPLLLLLLAIPRLEFDTTLMLQLRRWAVDGAGLLLDASGVLHERRGLVIAIPGRHLFIEEACSGINSLMAIVASTLFVGLWARKSARRLVLLLAIAVALVVALNMVRIAAVAAAYEWWKIDLLSGTAHESASFVIFGLAMLLLASADRAINYVVGVEMPVLTADGEPAPPAPVRAPARLTSRGWALAAAYLLCGLLQVRQGYAAGYWPARGGSSLAGARHDDLAPPESLAGWSRLPDDPQIQSQVQTVHVQSARWLYRDGNLTAAVALDYPFRGYHDLSACYANAGWELGADAGPRVAGDPAGPFDAYRMAAPPWRGLLYFASFDEQGHWLARTRRPRRALLARLTAPNEESMPPAYQVQVFVPGYSTLSAEDGARVEALFLAARDAIRRRVLEQLGRP